MLYDLVAIGGSGAQFAEAVVTAAGWGLCDLPRKLIIVDADQRYFAGEGGETGIQALWRDANTAREFLAGADEGAEGRSNQPEPPVFLPPYSGPVNAEAFDAIDLAGLNKAHPLLQTVLTQEEADHNIKDGLFGMAKIGGLLTSAANAAQEKNAHAYPESLITKLDGSHLVILAGSVAGGTGAGFLVPTLKSLFAKNPNRPIHVYTFLPWFQLPTAAKTDGKVNPSNERMSLNASQGIRYLDNTVREMAARQGPAPRIKAVLFGLPASAPKPERRGDGDMGAPGPLQYYGVSLLSRGVLEDNIASQQPGPVYAVTVDGNLGGGESAVQLDKRPFAKYVRFKVAGKELPLGLLKLWLSAQECALETVAEENRYKEAFPRFMADNAAFLPKSVFTAISTAKPGMTSGGERQALGLELAKAAKERAIRVREQLVVLGQAQVDDADLSEAASSRPDTWDEAVLQDPAGIERILAVGLKKLQPNLEPGQALAKAFQTPGFGSKAARTLFLAGLRAGLAADIKSAPRPAGGVAALPVAAVGNATSELIELAPAQVKELVNYYARQGVPDSRSIPSPLGKASVTEHLVWQPPKPVGAQQWWLDPTERLRTIWLGVATGRFTALARYPFDGNAQRDPMIRLTGHAERADDSEPLRAHWVTVLGDAEHAVPVAASAPRVGWFDSVRLIEQGTNKQPPGDAKVRDSYENVRNAERQQSLADPFAGACWLLLDALKGALVGLQPGDDPSKLFPWYKLLEGWSAGADALSAQALLNPLNRDGIRAWFSVGPVPFHVGWQQGAIGRMPVFADVWLPRLLQASELEQMALVAASATLLGGTVVQWVQTGRVAEGRLPGAKEPLISLRGFQDPSAGLDLAGQGRGGALALESVGVGLNWPPQFASWQAFLPTLRIMCRQHGISPEGLPWALLSTVLGRQDASGAFMGPGTSTAAWAAVGNMAWSSYLAPQGAPAPMQHGWVNLFRSVPL